MTELSGTVVRFRALGGVHLSRGDEEELRTVLRQPKRLALLAYLVLATPHGFHRRDMLLAMFWAEMDQSAARHALRNALYNLRREVGESVIANRGGEEVGIAAGTVWCDAVEFELALDVGRHDSALKLYAGDLLAGFYLSGASPVFEEWVERERSRLRLRAADAAWKLASGAEREGKPAYAVEMARRALTLRPDDEPWLRNILALLYRLGDQAGALRTYEEFALRLSRDFEVEPAPETRALIRQVRERRPTREEFVMPRRSSGANERQLTPDSPELIPVERPITHRKLITAIVIMLILVTGLVIALWMQP